MYLTDEIKITRVHDTLADGQTDVDGDAVDMAGFDGVTFVGLTGAITTTGTVTLAAEQSTEAADNFVALADVTAQAAAAADSNKVLVLDVYRPNERYVRPTITRATADSVYGGTIAIQYRSRSCPTTHDSASLAAAVVQALAPAETS